MASKWLPSILHLDLVLVQFLVDVKQSGLKRLHRTSWAQTVKDDYNDNDDDNANYNDSYNHNHNYTDNNNDIDKDNDNFDNYNDNVIYEDNVNFRRMDFATPQP